MSEIRVSEIRGSEIRGSEIRISSNHRELHGAIFYEGHAQNMVLAERFGKLQSESVANDRALHFPSSGSNSSVRRPIPVSFNFLDHKSNLKFSDSKGCDTHNFKCRTSATPDAPK